ncbi:MAG: oligosaccharide flippase family protein [Proteobacteria bacterium]|nr:oligosaccharide flippase family protein [Pseudomonadota bacterium]MBU6424821.1 oligosaccharide flippase family protein [Rhodospirillales bacterium]
MSEDDHKHHLGRGFNWLGGAAIIAKVTDFVTIIAVLMYLTKVQVGIGSLVLSIGMVVEAFDGLGTNEALVQAKETSERQLQSLFWFIMAAALLVGGAAVALSPAVGWIYGMAGMPLYFLALAAKQPLVGVAVIPLALLNRELKYEKIAAVNVTATFGAAMVRLAIAMMGGGTWALVGGYFASGVFILAGALWARPFRLGWHFSYLEIKPLVSFGLKSASANIFEQIFKNIDYLLVGWFYGAAPLAVYRVAFDVAMEPAMAVGTIINRTSLPVFAKVAAAPAQLRDALFWALQRLANLVAPLMAGLGLMAVPLMGLLHDSHGHSYAAAALPLQILAAAAVLRIASQLITPLLMGTGQPGKAASLSFITLTLLGGFILLAGITVRGPMGLVAVAAAWLAIYPFLLGWSVTYLRRVWQVSPLALLKPFVVPGLAVAFMVAFTLGARALPFGSDAVARIAAAAAATGLAYGGLVLWGRLRR